MNDDNQIMINIIFGVFLLCLGAACFMLSIDTKNNKNEIGGIECRIERIETSSSADVLK